MLLIVDMINDLNFPDNEELVRRSEGLGKNVARLKNKCQQAGIPVIYVNDNVGSWRSDFQELVRKCISPKSAGRGMVRQIAPTRGDLLVLKPRHSVFYGTPVDVLLTDMKATSIILVGLLTHSCVLLSASDAYMRGYRLSVPQDCVAGRTEHEHRSALKVMESSFRVHITPFDRMEVLKRTRDRKIRSKAA